MNPDRTPPIFEDTPPLLFNAWTYLIAARLELFDEIVCLLRVLASDDDRRVRPTARLAKVYAELCDAFRCHIDCDEVTLSLVENRCIRFHAHSGGQIIDAADLWVYDHHRTGHQVRFTDPWDTTTPWVRPDPTYLRPAWKDLDRMEMYLQVGVVGLGRDVSLQQAVKVVDRVLSTPVSDLALADDLSYYLTPCVPTLEIVEALTEEERALLPSALDVARRSGRATGVNEVLDGIRTLLAATS